MLHPHHQVIKREGKTRKREVKFSCLRVTVEGRNEELFDHNTMGIAWFYYSCALIKF